MLGQIVTAVLVHGFPPLEASINQTQGEVFPLSIGFRNHKNGGGATGGSNSTCRFRHSGLGDRVLLYFKFACHIVKVGGDP